jgi:CHAD domain-containing protein
VAQLDRLLDQEAGVRAGEDPEAVHRMRVATRRLRAWARFVDELGPARHPLKELADALGPLRDQDVLIAGLERESADHDRSAVAALADAQRPERAVRRAELLRRLDGPLLADLRGLRDRLTSAEIAAPRRARHARAALRRLRRRGRALKAASSTQLHAIRLAAKRYRYTLELLAPALEAEIAQATALQDTLGALNDDDLAVSALLDRIAADPAAHALAGQVRLRLARRDEALARFQELWQGLPSGKALLRRIEEHAP